MEDKVNLSTSKLCIKIMPRYKHLFFDLDHTLWDFDANARETLAEPYVILELDNRVNSPFVDFYLKRNFCLVL